MDAAVDQGKIGEIVLRLRPREHSAEPADKIPIRHVRGKLPKAKRISCPVIAVERQEIAPLAPRRRVDKRHPEAKLARVILRVEIEFLEG